MSRAIKASFWRGGTSRGLLFPYSALVNYPQHVINSIVLKSLGSPDLGGRQIDGLGGGVSSLSKVSIVGKPNEVKESLSLRARECDVYWKMGQVGVRDAVIDWTANCGNLLSAVAVSAITTSIIPYSVLFTRARALPTPISGPLLIPISIYLASNDQIMLARVPVDPYTLQIWEPAVGEGMSIAGVPGEAAGIELELPIEGPGVIGNSIEQVEIDGVELPISIISAGLPNIFIDPSSLNTLSTFTASALPPNLLSLPNATLLSFPNLATTLETIRTTAAKKFGLPLSLASPKITLISTPLDYTASDGTFFSNQASDIMVRATSSGDMHASIPGTTLAAVNIGSGVKGNLIYQIIHGNKSRDEEKAGNGQVDVRASHIAGISTSSARFEGGRCEGVIIVRTAREIMRGEVMIPEAVFEGIE